MDVFKYSKNFKLRITKLLVQTCPTVLLCTSILACLVIDQTAHSLLICTCCIHKHYIHTSLHEDSGEVQRPHPQHSVIRSSHTEHLMDHQCSDGHTPCVARQHVPSPLHCDGLVVDLKHVSTLSARISETIIMKNTNY